MKDNTVNVQDIEIYLDNINIYADEYINTVLCISPDNENYKKEVSDSFVDMIFYIADHIQKPSNDNIELLDKMFNTYVRLCSKYHVLPTLSIMLSTNHWFVSQMRWDILKYILRKNT